MIGTTVSCTLWQVGFRHKTIEPVKEHPKHVEGMLVITTADPTGGDLIDVARHVVLGAKAQPEHEFTLTRINRGDDVRGLATVHGHGKVEGMQLVIAGLEHKLRAAEQRVRELEAQLEQDRLYETRFA